MHRRRVAPFGRVDGLGEAGHDRTQGLDLVLGLETIVRKMPVSSSEKRFKQISPRHYVLDE